MTFESDMRHKWSLDYVQDSFVTEKYHLPRGPNQPQVDFKYDIFLSELIEKAKKYKNRS